MNSTAKVSTNHLNTLEMRRRMTAHETLAPNMAVQMWTMQTNGLCIGILLRANSMRCGLTPPACIAHTSMFVDLCLKLHVLEVAHVYYRTQCGNLPESRINERYRYVAYRQFVMWIMDILPTWKKYSCTAVIFRETFSSPGYCGFKCPALD
ncbi:hypothetical protein CAPTEDRAFT_226459 [Capitella teleta]|uniref:P2X purinoreceptor 7 intracellular domain-containing protein n=1 Tax=Capitella teleta TaxID=283909 RepID=R7UXX8_CAPTE|nr:hypothetical protein CAPTEDRAFT_226459 [Capitella teleta]|eukprot:ELU11127.1 hypothetical protein CAPTEDRAFT_226459 [Capitella teleta]